MKKILFLMLLTIGLVFCGCGHGQSTDYDDSGKLSDSEIESVAVQTLYEQLLAYEGNYDSIDAGACKYEISSVERSDGQVEVYGRVVFYDKFGNVTDFGGTYQGDFTVHMTEWGDSPWCEIH